MEAYYINLKNASTRRKAIEELLDRFDSRNLIRRFEALDVSNIKGKITDGEIGCFRSHEALIQSIFQQNLLILEDDIVFNNDLFKFLPLIDKLLSEEYEIIFLATLTPYFDLRMTDILMKLLEKTKLNSIEKYTIVDGKLIYRAGTIAYAVSSSAKDKILAEIETVKKSDYDTAIDTLYFNMIQNNKLKSGVIFPFLVACSVEPTQLTDRKSVAVQEIYDEYVNLFSGITDHENMLIRILSSILDKEINKKKLIASLLNYKHFNQAK